MVVGEVAIMVVPQMSILDVLTEDANHFLLGWGFSQEPG